ncbi:MAG: YfhO family protein [Candidatus Roizmanbacteria bacterium]|nr:YfhO family protein [Candidatus Roizmanbacteria bacterium]
MTKRLLKHWPVLFIIAVWFIFSHPYFLNNLVPFPSRYLVDFFPPWNNLYAHPYKNGAMPDIITQIYPWKQLTIDSWKSGQVPGWNPYQFSGNPHLANVQSAVFTPFNLLFFVLPFIDAWSVLILLQPLLAGLFMYLFMRSLKVHDYGSVLSAISFMFCGFMVSWMAYGTLGYAILYIPLLLYGINRYIERKDILSSTIIIASVALSFLGGHIQMSIYFLLTGFAYAIFSSWQHKSPFLLFSIALHLLIGLALSLPQLLPSNTLYHLAIRSELYRTVEAIPIQYIVTILAPDFFGNPVTRNDWFGHYAEWGGFIGVVGILLGGLAFFVNKTSKYVQFFTVFALGMLILAIQSPLVPLIVQLKIPVISTSGTSRIIVLFSFAMSVLAGFGLDALRSINVNKRITRRPLYVYFGVVIGIVLTVWMLLSAGNLLFISETAADALSVARRNFILPSGLVFATAAAVLLFTFIKNTMLSRVILFSLIAMASFDMLRFAVKWMPFDEREFVFPSLPVLEYMQENAGLHRVHGTIGNEALVPFGLFGIEGYDPLYIRRYGELVQSATDGTIQPPERSVVKINAAGVYTKKLLDLLGVKYIFYSRGDGRGSWVFPFWNYPESIDQNPVYRDDFYELYENTDAFDRAFLVHDYIVETNDKKIIDYLFSSETNLSSTVVLEKNPPVAVETCDIQDQDKVDLVSYTPNRISIKVDTDCPGILVLTDNYYPGWKAMVNEKIVPILRANYTFRAVGIPAGVSRIVYSYNPYDSITSAD